MNSDAEGVCPGCGNPFDECTCEAGTVAYDEIQLPDDTIVEVENILVVKGEDDDLGLFMPDDADDTVPEDYEVVAVATPVAEVEVLDSSRRLKKAGKKLNSSVKRKSLNSDKLPDLDWENMEQTERWHAFDTYEEDFFQMLPAGYCDKFRSFEILSKNHFKFSGQRSASRPIDKNGEASFIAKLQIGFSKFAEKYGLKTAQLDYKVGAYVAVSKSYADWQAIVGTLYYPEDNSRSTMEVKDSFNSSARNC